MIDIQAWWPYGKVDYIVTLKQGVFDIEGLFDGQSSVMISIDYHVLLLVRYSMQGNLLSFVVGGEHIVQGDDCHIS
jgi:hypothetical protein